MNTPNLESNLLFRRQYYIGPKFVDRFKSWNRIKVGKNIHVTAHPDLTVTTAKKGDTELALLGFMFDSENYQSDHKTILNEIIGNNSEFADVIKATSRYAGRWILIYTKGDEGKILHDPAGLRQVFYTNHESNTWCSAQPHILAELLDIQDNQDKDLRDYLNSKQFSFNEHFLIGNKTLYEDVYRLYPNHYLDLADSSYLRYWPNKTLNNLSVDEVVNSSSNILTELIKSANYRHSIAQTVTAGWDTRLLLAASKSIKNDVYYFVHRFPNMDNNHQDLYIPQELSLQHQLDLNVIDCVDNNVEFNRINKRNVSITQSDKKKLQHYNYFLHFDNKLIISGNVSPLIKEQFPSIDNITAINLARLLYWHNNKYAINKISKWLKESIYYSKKYDINIEQIFYWEIKFGSWGPMFNSELDIAVEEFSPYNCRNLINLMFSIPKHFRTKPNVIIYSKIINNLWPELLEIHVNPQTSPLINKNQKKFIHKGMDFLRKIGLYNLVRFFYRKLIFR